MLSKVTLSGTGSNEKNITQYFYNHDGIETEMRTGLSSDNDTSYLKTEYVYDSHNRLIRTKDSTGYNSGTITYDLNGNVLTNTDANGNITTNTYDALNRVLASNTVNPKDSKKNVIKSYKYDNMGRITETVNNDLTTTIFYDTLGRKYTEGEHNKNGYSIFRGYFYEGVSQYVRQELTGLYHLLFYSDKTYEYDSEMRVVKVKESGNETASYTYDANGNKKSETLANGVTSTYTYNNNNKVIEITNRNGNSRISSYEYSYYLDGSDACKVRNESGIIETTEYEYDGLKRLTEESVAKGNNINTYSYEYDDYGNRSKMMVSGTETYETVYDYSVNGKYTALLQKEVKTVEKESNPLDLNSNVKQTVYTYDANGNQIKKTADGKTETNTYDGLNQLIGFTDGETTASYAYNLNGLRYEKTVNGQTINHVWDGNQQIIADVIDNQFYEADCYIRGTNLVAKYNFWNGKKSEYTYYTQNAHGDVVNLTDKDGKVTKSYKYDAFGVEKNINKNDTNAFRYCGEYYDKETATVYLRARNYNPSTGRFISRDPYSGKNEEPLSLNKYTYCQNNPLIFVDPSGKYGIVIYGSYPYEENATKDNEEQANIIREKYEVSYGECYVYEVGTAEEFVNVWNSLDDSNGIDEIQVICHGTAYRNTPDKGVGCIYFGDYSRLYSSSYTKNSISASEYDKSRRLRGLNDQNMKDVMQKNVGSIYFSACNTSNLDFKTNISEAFAQKNIGAEVTGWDGGVYFKRSWWKIFTANWDEPMGMESQSTFKYFKNHSYKQIAEKRNPSKVSYQAYGPKELDSNIFK